MRKKRMRLFTGILAAAAIAAMTGCSSGTVSEAETEEAQESASDVGNAGIVINVEDVGTQASYYDTTVDGTDVEIFAVLASDGTVRLAMNT
ncbi:MAG: hypothetical protein LIO75_00295 [Lachnospiraceae bacterium]|nr:hypothetical protein [Lachnospiraceae bacterium]